MARITTVLWAVLFTAIISQSSIGMAETLFQSSWQSEWESTVKAAQKEGQVTLYIQGSFDQVFKVFQRKYPKIKVKVVGEPQRRIMVERRAGKFLADLYLGGIVTPNTQFFRAKAFTLILGYFL